MITPEQEAGTEVDPWQSDQACLDSNRLTKVTVKHVLQHALHEHGRSRANSNRVVDILQRLEWRRSTTKSHGDYYWLRGVAGGPASRGRCVMPRKPGTYNPSDVTRAIELMEALGKTVTAVKFHPDGTFRVMTSNHGGKIDTNAATPGIQSSSNEEAQARPALQEPSPQMADLLP